MAPTKAMLGYVVALVCVSAIAANLLEEVLKPRLPVPVRLDKLYRDAKDRKDDRAFRRRFSTPETREILDKYAGVLKCSYGHVGRCMNFNRRRPFFMRPANCPQNTLCIRNRCCRVMPEGAEKTGSCPANIAEAIPADDTPCYESCNAHTECGGTQLCCSHGCNKLCMDPIVEDKTPELEDIPETVKNGTCPTSTGLGMCVENCSGDSTCPRDLKCCSNGCGHDCAPPVLDAEEEGGDNAEDEVDDA